MTELSVNKKTTNSFTVTFTEDGDVTNITGWTVFFTVKEYTSQEDDDAVISKTITVHTNPTAGITTILLSPTDTNIAPGSYYYDIAFIDTDDNRRSINTDNFVVKPIVTQRSS